MSVVTWRERALDELADIYVAATSEQRVALTAEVDEINQTLTTNALFEGESRGGYGRVVIRELLVAFYTVIPHQPTRVLQVRPNKPLRK
jgi:hypothetical protein